MSPPSASLDSPVTTRPAPREPDPSSLSNGDGTPSDPTKGRTGIEAEVLGDPLARAEAQARRATDTWRDRSAADSPWLLSIPDVGPACEVLLADRLFHDLADLERDALVQQIQRAQHDSGAWLDVSGQPDLSITSLAWWALRSAGMDPRSDAMVRARRVVHELGGAQRASFTVRLWMAMGGQIPWAWLPAVPRELWLLPAYAPFSPLQISPWARGMLTPYLLLASAPAHLNLPSAQDLLVKRPDGDPIPPRLTRPGLPGDLLQAFDRSVKLVRKFPRGPLSQAAQVRAQQWLGEAQQEHGGWFSLRPTVFSLVAMRVLGTQSDHPDMARGLAYLRRARGRVDDQPGVLSQSLTGTPMAVAAHLTDPGDTTAVNALLREELDSTGPWQLRANAGVGGWPVESGARQHLDLAATCRVMECLRELPAHSPLESAAWAALRRANDVVLAMQEGDGSFSRFERGESEPFMRHLPWRDADLLAFGTVHDEARVRLTAVALGQLGASGFDPEDDRLTRGLDWLRQRFERGGTTFELESVTEIARCLAQTVGHEDPFRQRVDRELRRRQCEDGTFGSVAKTGRAIEALVSLTGGSGPCIQAHRAAHALADQITQAGTAWGTDPQGPSGSADLGDGLGLSPRCVDPSAGARTAWRGLRRFRQATEERTR